MVVGIINTGAGNIASIQRMLEQLGAAWINVSSQKDCMKSEALIIPGVGHFDNAMRSLHKLNLIESINIRVREDKIPTLGICLGMQLLCRGSEEGSEVGLGFIDADVKRFDFRAGEIFKIPHMGWNVVHPVSSNPLLLHADGEMRFYFVHSYRVVPDDYGVVIGAANYGGDFCAAFQKENIFGVQFHPEKSHRFGMALMKRFLQL